MNAAPDSADVCLIKMIHCYAAWFCQEGGGGVWQGLNCEPVIGWPFGDPELLEVLRCQTWFWGEVQRMQLHDAVGWAVSGWAVCWRHFGKCAKIWVKCSGKATVVSANVHLQSALKSQHLPAHQCWSAHLLLVLVWLPEPVCRAPHSQTRLPTLRR